MLKRIFLTGVVLSLLTSLTFGSSKQLSVENFYNLFKSVGFTNKRVVTIENTNYVLDDIRVIKGNKSHQFIIIFTATPQE